ncbi:MAG: hypothetical protein IJG68_05845, partial [Bacilli bacterium]|nr:hypothetical protein [Bacilli bacterium]
MAIPNVTVNVNELSTAGLNVLVPFIPAIILKTKSGPIGTIERINNESEFIAKFGQSDITTPAAYALQKYLKLYQYAYVTRVANEDEASKGSLTLSFGTEHEILSTLAEVPEQTVELLNKPVSEMISTDTKILSNGAVKGTLYYITGWTEFDGMNVENQSGYYVPVKLNVTGETLTIKKNGIVTKEVEFDPELVLRVSQTDTFEIIVDGTSIITLNFTMSAFDGSADPITDVVTLDLIKAETKYATDLQNGKSVKLVFNATNEKIYIDVTDIMGKNITTIKEDISIGTLKAAERDADGNLIGGLEFILDKLVTSANAISGIPLEFTNLFTDKTETDDVPTIEQFTEGFEGYIQNGNSGNDVNVANTDIMDLIDLYNFQDYPIDEMVIPEYRDYEVVNYAVEKGKENFYRVIAQATGLTIDDIKTSVQNYVQDNRGYLEIYANDVTYVDFTDEDGNLVPCPVSVAVLNAYAAANRQNPWLSIAGVNRGTLTQVTGLVMKMSRSEMDELYDNVIPINTINYISSVGYVVWGNKTSAKEEDTKIFDRVNVARLITYMNRELITYGWQYLFEPITLTLFTEFKASLENLCESIKEEDGIEDYVVICNSSNNTDETIAKNELHALIQVKPTEALEYVIIDLTGTDTITISVEET